MFNCNVGSKRKRSWQWLSGFQSGSSVDGLWLSTRKDLPYLPLQPQRPIECLRYSQCLKLFPNEWMNQSRIGHSLTSVSNSKGTSTQRALWTVPGNWELEVLPGDSGPKDGALGHSLSSKGKGLNENWTPARNVRSQITVNGSDVDPCHIQTIGSLSGLWEKNLRSLT